MCTAVCFFLPHALRGKRSRLRSRGGASRGRRGRRTASQSLGPGPLGGFVCVCPLCREQNLRFFTCVSGVKSVNVERAARHTATCHELFEEPLLWRATCNASRGCKCQRRRHHRLRQRADLQAWPPLLEHGVHTLFGAVHCQPSIVSWHCMRCSGWTQSVYQSSVVQKHRVTICASCFCASRTAGSESRQCPSNPFPWPRSSHRHLRQAAAVEAQARCRCWARWCTDG